MQSSSFPQIFGPKEIQKTVITHIEIYLDEALRLLIKFRKIPQLFSSFHRHGEKSYLIGSSCLMS
jgi:hypothetical protein